MNNPYQPPPLRPTSTRALYVGGIVLIVIAVLLPILGLAGTIAGMMYSFAEISGDETTPQRISSGISFSLITTVVGLIIGIPSGIAGTLMLRAARRGDQTGGDGQG